MLAELDTARLNVAVKQRANLFTWRGQFTPEFIDYLLESYARPGQRVLDPFCGSGTVLQEAASHRLAGLGLEINPAAYAMAKFFSLSGLSLQLRRDLVGRTRTLLHHVTAQHDPELPLFQTSTDYRKSATNLLVIARQLLAATHDRSVKLLLLLSLFRAESTNNGSLVATVNRAFHFLSDELLRLPYSERAPVAKLSDARNAHLAITEETDLIVTSPPYINVFNYHQNYRALLELLGFDMLKVAHSELGSNRKHRGNRFLTVIQYCLDIEQALHSFAQCLSPNGLLIMVLGRESRVRGIPFANSAIVSTLIEQHGAFSRPMSYERVFVNRFGQSIFEDILIAQRIGNPIGTDLARPLAARVLQRALENAAGDVKENIAEALSSVPSVCPSPLFDKPTVL
ncbi:MAG: hypothetical protein HOP18_28225 [Deltaproteobacteria bacterium]|nr:hypothetical protein [Deltaproteobacteria bacterium]